MLKYDGQLMIFATIQILYVADRIIVENTNDSKQDRSRFEVQEIREK